MEILKDFLVNNVIVQEIIGNPAAQLSGIFAMFLSILGYTQKDDKKVIKVFLFSNGAWIVHFYFLGTFSAMIACIIGMARLVLSLKYKRNKKFFYGITAAILISGVATYENHLSTLPVIASVVSAYGFFFFERIKLRLFMLISSVCWLIFSFGTFSIGGVVSDSIVLGVLIFTLIKMIIEENGRTYFRDKIMAILRNPTPDLGRFIVFRDYIKTKKISFFQKLKILREKILEKIKRQKDKKLFFFKKQKKV